MSVDNATATLSPAAAAAAAALAQPTPSSLPADYVETDAAECGQAKIAHLLGIFGILGTGIYYLIKRNDARAFLRDQMVEAFNFHLLVFAAQIALGVASAVAGAVIGVLGMVLSLAGTVIAIGALVLSIMNALKAGKGQVARYPARLRALK